MGLKDTNFGARETAQCLKHEDLDLHNPGHFSLIQPAGEVRDAVTPQHRRIRGTRKHLGGSWRDGKGELSTCCSCTGPEFRFQCIPSGSLPSVTQGLGTFFWPPQAANVPRFTDRYPCRQNIPTRKIIKKKYILLKQAGGGDKGRAVGKNNEGQENSVTPV